MSGWGWFAILINIPISIIVGLLLPKIQQWMDDRGKSSREKQKGRQAEQYKDAMFYALHSDLLNAKMLHLTLWVSLYTLILVIGITMFQDSNTMLDSLLRGNHPHIYISRILETTISGTLLIILLGGMSAMGISIVKEVKTVNRLYMNVRFFDLFIKEVPDDLRDKDREEFIMNAVWDRTAPGFNQNVKFLTRLADKKVGNDTASTQNTIVDIPSHPSAP